MNPKLKLSRYIFNSLPIWSKTLVLSAHFPGWLDMK